MSGQVSDECRAPLWDVPGVAVIYRAGQPSPRGCSGYLGSLSGTASGLYADFWGNGVVVSYPAQAALGTSALWGIAPQSDVCSHPHGLTICPATGDNTLYGPALFTVKRPGSKLVVSLTVGLEGDGAVARTIIGSFMQRVTFLHRKQLVRRGSEERAPRTRHAIMQRTDMLSARGQ
jgi:hypothetical protein